jgi:hypothetical protein
VAINWPSFSGAPIAGNNAPGDAIERMVARETIKAARDYKALQAKKAADLKAQKELDRQSMAAVDRMVRGAR